MSFPLRLAARLMAVCCASPLSAQKIDLERVTPVPADEPIPIADFFRRSVLHSPQLNPAGTHFAAFVSAGRDSEELMVYDIEKAEFGRLGGRGDRDVYSFRWLTDTRLAFSLSREKMYAEGLLVADVGRLRHAYPILQRGLASLLSVPPENPTRPLVWVQAEFSESGGDGGVVQVNTDLNTGPLISPGRAAFDWNAAREMMDANDRHILRRYPLLTGALPAAYLPDRAGEVAFAVGSRDGIFYLYRLVGREWVQAPVDLDVIDVITHGDEPDQLVVLGPRQEGQPRALQFLNAATGELGQVLLQSETHDFSGWLYRHPVSGHILGVNVHDSGPRMVWFNETYRALQKVIEGYFPGLITRIIGTDHQQTKCLVVTFSDRQPATYYRIDFAKRELGLIKASRPWIDPPRMRPMSIMKFATRDGRTLEAYVTLPEGASKERPVPLVVLAHGGPHARDTWGYNSEVQFLASRGYAVLQPNYRGSTGTDWQFPEEDQWAFRKMHDDVTDAVKTVLRTGLVDPDRLAIMGGSFGGYLALCGVAYEPDLYRCAVTFAGVFDWAAMIKESKYYQFDSARYAVLLRRLGDPQQQAEKFAAMSPLHAVSQVKVPVFVAHGKDDQVVAVSESRRLIRQLKEHQVPHEVLLVSREGHGMGHLENDVELYSRIEAFLAQHLAPRG